VPRIFVQSTRDQYGPVSEISEVVEKLEEPKRLILVEASDHFFAGGLERLEEEIAGL
jgi:alpha/beta superfamily hydrolase